MKNQEEKQDRFVVSDETLNFRHTRKGDFKGKIVRTEPNSEWVEIEIMEDCELTYQATMNQSQRFKTTGETITARKSLLTIME